MEVGNNKRLHGSEVVVVNSNRRSTTKLGAPWGEKPVKRACANEEDFWVPGSFHAGADFAAPAWKEPGTMF